MALSRLSNGFYPDRGSKPRRGIAESNLHRVTALHGIVLLYTALALSGCGAEPNPGSLAGRAAQAKREGKRTVLFSELTEAVEGNLDELIRSYAIVSVRPARLAVATTVVESAIYTWNVYRDVEVLSRVAPEPSAKCLLSHPPSDVKLGKGEIAAVRGGGSATVDGVDITMTTNQWIPDDSGRRYVVFAVLCSDQVMVLPLNGRAAFEVDARGVLSTAPSAATFRYQQQAEELGTLKALLEYRDKVMAGQTPGKAAAPPGG